MDHCVVITTWQIPKKQSKLETCVSFFDAMNIYRGELSCSALPAAKFFAISKWRMASNVLPKNI